MSNVVLYSPITTAVNRCLHPTIRAARGHELETASSDRACSGIWRLLEQGENEQLFTALPSYTEKGCL